MPSSISTIIDKPTNKFVRHELEYKNIYNNTKLYNIENSKLGDRINRIKAKIK